uniref:Zinc finger CCHC domain-containing protein 7 n=1 Tax=Nyssomyia neivai TaxID=330878 RepID=A0A1L8DT30_9DIPT
MPEVPQKILGGKQSSGRYFATFGKPAVKKFGGGRKPQVLGMEKASPGRRDVPKFTPYQSFLEGIKLCSQAVQKKTLNPMAFRKPDEVPQKRERKRNRRKDKKKVTTIVLDSSEDEKDEDVVEIPVPPPPLVCLSSDESQQEAPPKVRRKISPRGSSPSSSILSDDFIAAKDRLRLAESQSLVTNKRAAAPMETTPPKDKLSDISTSDSEDFLPDADDTQPRYQKRKRLPPSPKNAAPFVHKGEAIPNAITTRTRRKSIDVALKSAHRSDEEFITILSTIATGDTSNSQAASHSDDEIFELVRKECEKMDKGDIVINIGENDVPVTPPWAEDETEPIQDVEEDVQEEATQDEELPEEVMQEMEEEEQEEESEHEEIFEHEKDLPPYLLHGWNDEMRRFYEESWGGEKFSLRNIINQMPNNNQWQINAKDLNFSRFHRTWREPQVMKLVCYMCGQSGHREPRCPNTLCLKCGNRAMVFGIACSKCADWKSSTCDICHTKGHRKELCPDSWRRYHSTVDDTAPNEEDVGASNPRKFCSICAAEGHLADACPCPVRLLEYPVSPWDVASYEGVYELEENTNSPDPFHTSRGEKVEFTWSESVKKSQFYGRFLNHCAVNQVTSTEEATTEDYPPLDEVREIPKDNYEEKIFLHRDFCQTLLSPRGQLVMKSMADEMSVEVNLRTSGHGNVLKLRGVRVSVQNFKQQLMRFLQALPKKSAEEQEMDAMHLPRERQQMIKFIREKMHRLVKYIGSAPELFDELKRLQAVKNRRNLPGGYKLDCTRMKLNMILLGQVGLREGKMHLKALKADLALLEKNHQENDVPQITRNSIFMHYRYIFTSFEHTNYKDLMQQFTFMRKRNKLPSVAIPLQVNPMNPMNIQQIQLHQRKKTRFFNRKISS